MEIEASGLLELPSDIAYLEIQVPDEPLVLREPESDEERPRRVLTTSPVAYRVLGVPLCSLTWMQRGLVSCRK